jgi:hypothetical protein
MLNFFKKINGGSETPPEQFYFFKEVFKIRHTYLSSKMIIRIHSWEENEKEPQRITNGSTSTTHLNKKQLEQPGHKGSGQNKLLRRVS